MKNVVFCLHIGRAHRNLSNQEQCADSGCTKFPVPIPIGECANNSQDNILLSSKFEASVNPDSIEHYLPLSQYQPVAHQSGTPK
jgi:hypothetical protein